jgi:hypothetical protein
VVTNLLDGLYPPEFKSSDLFCVGRYWAWSQKYIRLNHFQIEQIIEDKYNIIDSQSTFFVGYRGYGEVEFGLAGRCKTNNTYYSTRSYYVMVYQDPDLEYMGPIDYRNGQFVKSYRRHRGSSGRTCPVSESNLVNPDQCDVLEENAYALIGVDRDKNTDPSERNKNTVYFTECK